MKVDHNTMYAGWSKPEYVHKHNELLMLLMVRDVLC